jgi:hypothetical protein
VIVAALFVVVFACMWGALRFHHEKLRVMREARAQAWTSAVGACQGGGGDVLDDIASNAQNSGSPAAPDTDNDYANIEDSTLTNDSGYTSAQVEGFVAMPGLIGGTAYAPTGRMFIRCNEDPPPDDLLQIARQAMKILTGSVGF